MKKSKFTEAQIAFILKQAEEGTPVAEVCRKAGNSDATFYGWRKGNVTATLAAAERADRVGNDAHLILPPPVPA